MPIKPKKTVAPGLRPTSEEDMEEFRSALDTLPLYATTSAVMVGKRIIRLSFGESMSGKTNFHSTIVMSIGTAASLADGLKDAVEKAREAMEVDDD